MAQPTVQERLLEFLMAAHPKNGLLPELLPLIAGAVVIELYFGKHSQEKLGWNTSVGNAIIWITTGLNLLLTSSLTVRQRYVSYFLVSVGGFVGYMDFYHKWSDTAAFIVSSAGIVYSLAYVTVVAVKTGMPVNPTSVKAGIIFIIGVNLFFKVVKAFETPAKDDLGMNFSS